MKKFFIAITMLFTLAYADKYSMAKLLIIKGVENNLPPKLSIALGMAESNLVQDAVSYDGTSIGLCQISIANNNSTWLAVKYLGTDKFNLFDPEINASIGCAYLADLIDRYKSVYWGLSAYNWGPAKVDRIKKDKTKLPEKVKKYVSDIYKYMDIINLDNYK